MSTIMDVARLAYEHRNTKFFNDSTILDYANTISAAIKRSCFRFIEEDNKIIGFIYWHQDDNKKTFYVENIVCLKLGVIKQFLIEFTKQRKGYTLEAHRDMKLIKYNTPKLLEKFNITL